MGIFSVGGSPNAVATIVVPFDRVNSNPAETIAV
jgi:hypothetical protein